MMAAELDHAEVVDVLIRSGADRNLRDKAGKSVFDRNGPAKLQGIAH